MTDETPLRPVTKTIGAVTFVDPYDWLQRDTPEALDWMWRRDAEAQVAAQAWPGHAALKGALTQAQDAGASAALQAPRRVAGKWIHVRASTSGGMPCLWLSDALNDPGRLVVESSALAGPGDEAASTRFHWFEPSPNGEYVACAVVSRGEMVGTWRVVELATGRVLDFSVPAVAYNGALPGWLPDASGFYLGDRLEDGRHRVGFHPIKPGVPARPERVFEWGEIPANVSGVTVEMSPDGSRAFALAGPHERIAYMVGELASNDWRPFLPPHHEGECQGVWQGNDEVVARVHDDDFPQGRVVAMPVATSRDAATWRTVVPPSRAIIKAVTVIDGHVCLAEVLDCAARFRVISLADRTERIVPLEGPGTSFVAMLMRRFEHSDAMVFDFGSFVQATAHYHYDVATGRLQTVGAPPKRIDGIRVAQHFARSIDGTQVPYFLVHREDLDLSRPNPALINAYGGFNAAWMPLPLGHLAPFIEAGGILVHANLRGGGEYGKHWHDSGRLASKWNVFADLFAVADQVIQDGLTEPRLFAMSGASNGGLLAGAAIVHRPDLWRVVVPVVPIFDQLEPLPREPQFDAVRAIFLEDYGDPDHPVMSKVLHSYSPYHNVKEGTAYPAVYQVFGEKDLGCMPFNGRKFTAALRAATTSGLPVHLRVWKDVGHGSGTNDEAIEWLGFVMQQLGMSYPPRPA